MRKDRTVPHPGPASARTVTPRTYTRAVPETNTPTTAPTPADQAFADARANLTTYIAGIEAAHREQHPDPVGADGRTRWDAGQAMLRSAAWSDEEHAEVERLREVERDAVLAVHREKGGGA